MAGPRANMIFSAEDRASSVMRQISGGVDNLERSFTGLQAPFLRMQGLLAAFTGGAAVTAIKNLVGAIDDLDEAAQGLGTTAVQLAALRQAGGEAGIGAEKLDAALSKLNGTISEAAAGNAKAQASFKAFKSEALDLAVASGDSGRVLGAMADEFAKLQDSPAKTALAIDFFGEKLGRKMIPLLNQGSTSLERFTGLTDATVDASRRLQVQIDQLAATWDRLKFSIAGGVVPVINNLVDRFNRLDFRKIIDAGTVEGLFSFNLALAELGKQSIEAKVKQDQLTEALKLGGGAYSNEGRAALGNAQAVRDSARASEEAATADKKRLSTMQQLAEQFRKDELMRDLWRLRRQQDAELADEEALKQLQAADRMRDLLRLRRDDEREAAADEKARRDRARVSDLTGDSKLQQIEEDLAKLRQSLADGEIDLQKFKAGLDSVFGKDSDVEEGIKRQSELAGQLGLEISSSLGQLITSGGRAGDVMKALGQDVLKLITQMLILKPLAEQLKKLFSESGGGDSNNNIFAFIARILGVVLGGAGGGGEAMGTGAAPGEAVGSIGMNAAPTVNVAVNAGLDRAAVAQMVDLGVRAGLARAFDNQQRGGLGFA